MGTETSDYGRCDPGYEQCAVYQQRITRLWDERNQLYGYVNGLLGLLQLVRGRDDMPTEISTVLNTNHRATDAAAYLTQIVPP